MPPRYRFYYYHVIFIDSTYMNERSARRYSVAICVRGEKPRNQNSFEQQQRKKVEPENGLLQCATSLMCASVCEGQREICRAIKSHAISKNRLIGAIFSPHCINQFLCE